MSGHPNEELLAWIGRLGAVSPSDVELRFGVTAHAARARLAALRQAGLIAQRRLLHDVPPLQVATRAGLRQAGLAALGSCRVSAASFAHWRACARVAVFLEHRHPGRVGSDRELRVIERERGARVASADLGVLDSGEPGSHRPDLVVWPTGPESLPVAVEVELTTKAPRRLQAICRAWARTREVTGVVYYATAPVEQALRRVVVELRAQEIIWVVPVEVVEADLARRAADLARRAAQVH
jgi:hypothetical protein